MSPPVTFTVLGSRGYIGRHLADQLQSQPDTTVITDARPLPEMNLGHVIYCIGVTTDFASRLHDTMRAHVCKVIEVLGGSTFESFTYLSSTRVYERGSSGDESAALNAAPDNPADFYKISKIAGEAVCLTDKRPSVRVARLSNVLGFEHPPLTFVPSLIRDGLLKGTIELGTSPDSAKDYIMMADVLAALPRIALEGRERVYNVSSGMQTTHRQIVECIADVLGCGFSVRDGAIRTSFPETPATRLKSEFGISPGPAIGCLPDLCRRYAEILKPSA